MRFSATARTSAFAARHRQPPEASHHEDGDAPMRRKAPLGLRKRDGSPSVCLDGVFA